MFGVGLGFLILAVYKGGNLSILPNLRSKPAQVYAPTVGKLAPLFSLKSLEGKEVKLEDLQGHAVMINFWATWCPPCREEMSLLQKAHEKYAPDLVILAVNDSEEASQVKEFVEDEELTFTVLLDAQNQAGRIYRVNALPTSYFVDAKGVIRAVHFGLLGASDLAGYLGGIGVGK